ncbi:alpha/beta hydrolase [Bacillus sp. T3]|uniref:alpha/beta hydrolase n=1 Tax=Bacillus sp. T3 TaxID=467262 RepID=UPI0029822532|nr:alpha/beta hydrolase [Bacillus sp. T3]
MGSLLGILTAKRHPDYIEKYVGISQVVGGPETEKQCYEYCYKTAIERGNKKAIRKLKQIKEPPYDDWKKGLQVRSALSNKFGASVKNGGLPSLYFKRMLLSHEYTIFDIYKFLKGFSFSLDCLWPEIMKMNLLKEVDNLTMPIYFFLGKHDYSAPSLLAEEFLSNLKTSQKQIVWFAESAHMCNLEEQEKFTANLEHVLSL